MLKKIDKWLWIITHKKEPKVNNIHNTILYAGFLLAIYIFAGLVALGLGIKYDDVDTMVVGILALIWALIFYIIIRKQDKRDGYIEVLHKQALINWHEKRKKYGLE